jgi:16S rRNA C967 or C1407 C5-methylase (RsmB/RsmF family)
VGEILTIDGGERFLKLTPARHNTDGFFGAVLVRADG